CLTELGERGPEPRIGRVVIRIPRPWQSPESVRPSQPEPVSASEVMDIYASQQVSIREGVDRCETLRAELRSLDPESGRARDVLDMLAGSGADVPAEYGRRV